MKLTTKLLLALLLLFTTGLFASNMLLRKEYDKVDKNDLYWTYGKILEQPFRHLVIDGGNVTKIAYEQGPAASVRVFREWDGYRLGTVKAHVRNDTLFLNFPNSYGNGFEKRYLEWNTLVRIFSPELLSVNGVNTKLEMFGLNQKSLAVSMSGKSQFEVESINPDFDSLVIRGRDSSEMVFEMSPGVKNAASFHAKSVSADVREHSVVDIGRLGIDSLNLTISDSAGVLLSGSGLRKATHDSIGFQ